MTVSLYKGASRGKEAGISGVGRRPPDSWLTSFQSFRAIDFQLPFIELGARYIRSPGAGPTSDRAQGGNFRPGKQEGEA